MEHTPDYACNSIGNSDSGRPSFSKRTWRKAKPSVPVSFAGRPSSLPATFSLVTGLGFLWFLSWGHGRMGRLIGASHFSGKSRVASDELRKSRGAFFTPPEIANYLVKWAVQSPEDTVLEP